jgi:hypothetical protein
MKLGDRIKIHFEKEPMFEDGKPTIVDGEFTIIGVSYGLPHCFSEHCWSPGFNSFEYGEQEDGRPDIVSRGSVFVPTPDYLDRTVVNDLCYDKKTVNWEILA